MVYSEKFVPVQPERVRGPTKYQIEIVDLYEAARHEWKKMSDVSCDGVSFESWEKTSHPAFWRISSGTSRRDLKTSIIC